MAKADKGKLPPSFRKAAKKIAATGPAKTDRIIDPAGKPGTVLSVAGGMVKVKHDDGSTDIHPIGSVRKIQAPPIGATPATPAKKAAKKKRA